MKKLHSAIGDPPGEGIFPCRNALLDALPSLGSLQDQQVPSGILLRWGEQLDWPRSMLEGTSLEKSSALPRHIRLRDDLVIVANLLDQFGPIGLLETLWTDYAVAADSEAMATISAGPGVAAVTHYFIEAINMSNPHIRISTSKQQQGGQFQISLVADIGPTGQFLEHAITVSLARIALQLHPLMRQLTIEKGDWPRLHLRGASPETVRAMRKFGRIEVFEAEDRTTLFLPKSIFEYANKNYDPDIWSRAVRDLRRHAAQDVSALSLDALRLNLRQSLKLRQRVPTLEEYSHDLALSPRTMSRRLADHGVSFRKLVNDERMALAKQYLGSTEDQIERIAIRLGYSTANSFGRAFKKYFGSSPADWRATGQQDALAQPDGT